MMMMIRDPDPNNDTVTVTRDREWRDEQIRATRKREREEQEQNKKREADASEEIERIRLDRKIRDRMWESRSQEKNIRVMLNALYPTLSAAFAELGAYERAYGYTFYRQSYRYVKTQHVYKHRFMCWGFLPSTGAHGYCGARLVISQPFVEGDGHVKFDIKHCNVKHTCTPMENPVVPNKKRPKVSSSSSEVTEMCAAFERELSKAGSGETSANAYRRKWLTGDCIMGCGMNSMRVLDGSPNTEWGPVQYAQASTGKTFGGVFGWEFGGGKNSKRNIVTGKCTDVFVDCHMLKGGADEFRQWLSDADGDREYFNRWLRKYERRNSAMGLTYLVVVDAEPLDVQHTLMYVHKAYGFFKLTDDEDVCSAPHKSHVVFRIPRSGGGTALVISTECLRRYRMLTLQYQPFVQSMPRAPLLTQFWTLKARPLPPPASSSSSSFVVLGDDDNNNRLDLTRRYGMLATLEFIVNHVCGQLSNMRERMYGVHEPYFKIYDLLPEILSMYDPDLKVPIWETIVLERLRHNTFFPSLVHFICQRNVRADKGMKCRFVFRSTELGWLDKLFGPDSERSVRLGARYPYAKYLLRHMVAMGKTNGVTYAEISIPSNDWSKVREMPGTIPLPPKNCPLVYYLFELVGDRELFDRHERYTIYRAIGLQESYAREPRMVGTVNAAAAEGRTIRAEYDAHINVPKKCGKLLRQYERKCARETLFPREQRHIPFTQIKREMVQLDALYHTLLGMEHTVDFCPVDPRVAEKHAKTGDLDPSKVWTKDLTTTGVYGLTRISDPVHLATHQIDMPVGCVLVKGQPKKLVMFESSLYVYKGSGVGGKYTPLFDAYMLIRDPTLVMTMGENKQVTK